MIERHVAPAGGLAGWVNRHAVALVAAGSYLLAWVWWAPLLGRDLGDVGALGPGFLVFALAGGLMPSFAALLWRLLGGRLPPAAREGLGGPLRHPVWLLPVLALVPAAAVAGIGIQVLLGLRYDLGTVGSRLMIGPLWPLLASLGEEFAWRGVLLPLLRVRFGLLKAALLVGLVWGFWHLPADWIGLKAQGAWFWPQFLLQGPVLLTAHSLVLAWIWARSGGRILAALIYHFGITSSAILLGNQIAAAGGAAFGGNLLGLLPVLALAVPAGIALGLERGEVKDGRPAGDPTAR